MMWVFVGTIFTVIVGLAVARFADGMRGEKAAKSAIFIPGAISLVGAGVIWKFVYDGPPFEVGLLNSITKSIPGLPASMGGDGDRIWLLERGFGGRRPAGLGARFQHLPADRHLHLGLRPVSPPSSSRPRSRACPIR